MRGIIMLDGPDCAGKTTLAKVIEDRVLELRGKAMVVHQGKPKEGTCWDVHSQALIEYVKLAFNDDLVIIADRHFMSESVYGMVYRQGSEYPFAARHVDRCLHRFRALRVVCAPPTNYVVEKHREMKEIRQEEYDAGMDKVANRYLSIWRGGPEGMEHDVGRDYIQQLCNQGGVKEKIGWYHYDVTEHGKDMKSYASYLLHELEKETQLLPEELYDIERWRFTGFPHQQAVLLVGDRIGPGGDNGLHLPFYANAGSSLYLAQTLHKVGADESRVVIANIHDQNGVQTVMGLKDLCGRTVVMGREAERTMLSEDIHYDAKVRHPQHARRFNHHDDSYVKEMREALRGWAGVR